MLAPTKDDTGVWRLHLGNAINQSMGTAAAADVQAQPEFTG